MEPSHINSILENVVDGIITIGDHGLVEMFNPAAENIIFSN
jgi:nitrogen fixation/metabolism regulation signal transduction histidine kinase